MSTEGSDFDEVLKEAQEKGYAEADPTADIEGHDVCRKIAILSSIAYGKFIHYEDIPTEGITRITAVDMKYAKELGMAIKLLGTSRREENQVYALVAPYLVGPSSQLYSVMMSSMEFSYMETCWETPCSMEAARANFRRPAQLPRISSRRQKSSQKCSLRPE